MSTTANAKQYIDKDVVFKAAVLLMQSNGKTSSLEVKEHLRQQGYWAKQEPVRDYLHELRKEHNWNVNDVGHLEYSLGTTVTSQIEEEVIDLIADTANLDKDDINAGSILTIDLGLDHLDLIALGMAIDQKYNVQSSNMDWSNINNVSDLVKMVETLTGGGSVVQNTTNVSSTTHSHKKTYTPRKPAMVINDSVNPSTNPRVTINIDYKKVVTGTKDATDTCDGKDWYVSNKGTDPVIYDKKYSSDNVRTVYARLKGIKIQEVRAARVENL